MFKHWLSEEDKKLDEKFGIERKPSLGCLIVVVGSILVWGSIFWLLGLI